MSDEIHEKRSDFWMKIAGLSFGLWSVVVGMAVQSVNSFQREFGAYVLITERRITLLEERSQALAKALELSNNKK